MVVVGDTTAADARATVEKYFGDWKAEGPRPDVFPTPVPPNKPGQEMIPGSGGVQSEVTLAETLPMGYTDPDFPLLQLGNTALSGGFYASLLFHDLREVHGYVYTVSSAVNGGRNRSTFTVSYGADPHNVSRAARLVTNDLTSLQRQPLPGDRLIRAKALVIGELPVRQESYDGLSGQLLAYATTGRPLDQDRISARAQ